MSLSPVQLRKPGKPVAIAGVAYGAEGLVITDLARAIIAKGEIAATTVLVICRDGPQSSALARAIAFFAPDVAVFEFPAWDCLPYDRVSPHAGVVAQRMSSLSRLVRSKDGGR